MKTYGGASVFFFFFIFFVWKINSLSLELENFIGENDSCRA